MTNSKKENKNLEIGGIIEVLIDDDSIEGIRDYRARQNKVKIIKALSYGIGGLLSYRVITNLSPILDNAVIDGVISAKNFLSDSAINFGGLALPNYFVLVTATGFCLTLVFKYIEIKNQDDKSKKGKVGR